MTNEEFYDAEIAPALFALSKRCEARGMGVLALVNYDDEGSIAKTVALPKGSPAMLRYALALSNAWCEGGVVNIDAFIFSVMKEARNSGHTSIILQQLGVPTKTAEPVSP